MDNILTFKKKLKNLISQFERNQEFYKSKEYKEDQLRQQFLNPFFKALGWDMDNEQGFAPQYCEVVHEDRIEIRGKPKAPDYSFRIGGNRKFFVEAKASSINLAHDASPAFQLRRYAWSGKLPVSILTDFEDFAVYDCTIEPHESDSTGKARIKLINYTDYLENAEYLYNTFSKEAVLKGSFDKFAKAQKRGNQPVDKSFLNEIETWRNLLAKDIATNNSFIDIYQLNEAVQKTIDRIIFLRIAEDRGIEDYENLKKTIESPDTYSKLIQLFKKAHIKYNSNLFDFETDTLSLKLKISDRILDRIIGNLYFPKSPFEFSVIGVEILGSVYEQFLGKVIRLTKGHNAIIEEKPEVKKAGGVYYTPQYIVEYIVKNTVGELVKKKTPKEVSKLKICDPAMGSGSFLLGAYDFLLNWHLNYYAKNEPEKFKKAVFKDNEGNYILSTAEKKRILTNNIYGVDIDSQAVEVTKLSLALKMLENENKSTLNAQLKIFQERILPDLSANIKCGNSLIGSDYYTDKNISFLEEEEIRKVNAFDWDQEFKDIMGRSLPAGRQGFDAVIGNPPYVRQELLGEFKPYFQKTYRTYASTADLYTYFIEKGTKLINNNGFYSIIVANKWMRANYGEALRKYLKEKDIEEIVDFGDLPIFQGATTYPCIITIKGGKANKSFTATNVKTLDFDFLSEYVKKNSMKVDQTRLDPKGWSLVDTKTQDLLGKLSKVGTPLGEYVEGKIYRGILTGLNEAFVIDEETKDRLIKEDPKSEEIIKPFLAGRDIKRYAPIKPTKYLIFTRRGIDIEKYPAIKRHLEQYKKRLMPKPKGWKGVKWEGRKLGSYKWYEIQDAVDYYEEFENPKIILPDISIRGNFSYDKEGSFYLVNTCYIIPTEDLSLLTILNSKLINFYYRNVAPEYRGGYLRFIYQYIDQIPVPNSLPDNDLTGLSQKQLDLHDSLADNASESKKQIIQKQIDDTDKKINQIVYKLYGLSQEEIDVIEGLK